MALKMCIPCAGSGRVMGGGMMMKDCDQCDGRGKIQYVDDEIDYLAKKQSLNYKDAKQRLVDKANISGEQAEEYLDAELKKTKRGRKKRALQ
jgi:RecJ-like exonuclease